MHAVRSLAGLAGCAGLLATCAAPVAGAAPQPNVIVVLVDDCMSRILDTLDRLGIRDRTAIVFTSDNGGLANVTDNRPARAGKGSAYEGGVRVPLIVS